MRWWERLLFGRYRYPREPTLDKCRVLWVGGSCKEEPHRWGKWDEEICTGKQIRRCRVCGTIQRQELL